MKSKPCTQTAASKVPDVYDFDVLEEFLLAYVDSRKEQNPAWTFGVWARQMKLANRSSITRILKGERVPGEKMLDLLIKHFAFDSGRAEYFRHLALIKKSSNDSRTESAFRVRLDQLRQAQAMNESASDGPEQPLHWVSESDILMLSGTAPLEKASQLLKADRLEPIDSGGEARMFIAFVKHGSSKLGPITEFHVGFFSKLPSQGLESVGVLYKHLHCDNARLATVGRHVWGHVYETSDMEVTHDQDIPVSASIRSGEPDLIRIGFRRPAERQWEKIPPLTEYIAYSGARWAQCKYRIRFAGAGRRTPFDAASDEFSVRPGSEIQQTLAATGFKPCTWMIYTGCEGSLYPPQPFFGR